MVAQVGLLLFMFGVGFHLDIGMVRRRARSVAAVALSSMVVPFVLGVGLAVSLHQRHGVVGGEPVPFGSFALYLGIAMSVTAFPVLARIIVDLGLQHSRAGVIALCGAAVTDLLAWCVLALVVAAIHATGISGFVATVGYTVLYVATLVLAVRPGLRWLVGRVSGSSAAAALPMLVTAGVFLSAFITSLIGIHGIFGAFAFGLAMPRTAALGAAREATVEPLNRVSSLLLPVFFTVTGLAVDVTALTGPMLVEFGVVLVVACAGKLLSAGLAARASGLTWREAVTVGALMNTRGATELVILNIGVALGVLDGTLFTIMVLMALVTTAAAGLFIGHRPSRTAAPAAEEEAAEPTATPG
jgi:Kef-type K+ transport system membrane component KefB